VKERDVRRISKSDPEIRRVPDVRGGPLPPRIWLVVPVGHPDFREPKAKLKAIFYLHPKLYHQPIPYKFERDWTTFYIHPHGLLGSDGCIVMAPASRQKLMKYLTGNRPYFLKAVMTADKNDLVVGQFRTFFP